MKKLKKLYFSNQFFYFLIGFVFLFTLSFFFEFLFFTSVILFLTFIFVVSIDVYLLFKHQNPIKIKRIYPEKLSNGDENELTIQLTSQLKNKIKLRLIEELPIQFQYRDFLKTLNLIDSEIQTIHYQLTPKQRGEYHFGFCHVFISILGFVERKYSLEENLMIPCYPSFIQLKKYMLLATTNRLHELGVKKIRKIGTTLEFERIREYTLGDEYRLINWKATAKSQKLKVNQYQDEKSQPIISIIDTGRAMRMPFENLTLLDYAINSSLVLSYVAISKQDKSGLITFSKRIEKQIVPEKKSVQMQLISETLYNITTDFKESEFGKLYTLLKRTVNQRSLLFLYTNFETLDALNRQLNYLRLINKNHVLVVVIFSNSELNQLANTSSSKIRGIYDKIIAEKFIYEKQLIIKEMQSHGIQTILTEPKNLTINSINKYLEIKAKGLM